MGLILHACAGGAAGTLLIDSQMIDLKRAESGKLQIVTKIRLAPGRRRSLAILTMPESGGSYTVHLIFGAPTPQVILSVPLARVFSDSRNGQVLVWRRTPAGTTGYLAGM